MTMNIEFKTSVQNAIINKIQLSGSQNEAARQLGISPAHCKSIREGDFDKVSDKLLRQLAIKLKLTMEHEWQISKETKAFKFLNAVATDSQIRGLRQIVIGTWGSGKSSTLKEYSKATPNVFYIECESYFTKKVFLQELIDVMGVEDVGFTQAELIRKVIKALNKLDRPLLIIDEAGELEDPAFKQIKAISNKTTAGIIVAGTHSLQKRIEKRVRLQKETFGEFWDRFGQRFLEMPKPSKEDIISVCHANGVTDPQEIDNAAKFTLNISYRALQRVLKTMEFKKLNEPAL